MLVAQGAIREGGRRRWRWRRADKGWSSFTIAALEEVVHTLAAYDRFEGQGALQPLQLEKRCDNV